MKLNFVISNTYLNSFKNVLNILNQNKQSGHHIVIVPDRFSVSAEKEVFESLNIKSSFNIEVLTLSKLASKVLNNKLINKKLLTKQSGTMLVNKIILENKNNLKAFKKATKLTGFVSEIYETINQLKSSGITPEEFLEGAKDAGTAFKLKANDIALIYNEYEKELKQDFLDANSKLTLLNKNILNNVYLQNSHIYFGLFDSFTYMGYSVIESLVKTSKSVNIGFVSNTKQNNSNIYSLEMYNRLRQISRNLGIEPSIKNSFVKLKPDFNHILNNLYAFEYPSKEVVDDSINLFEGKNITDEVEWVAYNITKLVQQKDLRFNSINLAVSDISVYENTIKQVFNNYNIPYFLDNSINLSSHIFVKFLLSSLSVIRSNFNLEEVVNYTKNYFANISLNESNIFEDVINKYLISNNSFFNKLDVKFDKSEVYEEVRLNLLNQLKSFKTNIEQSKNVNQYVEAIKQFLNHINAEDKLIELEKEYKNNNNLTQQKLTTQVFGKVNGLFDELINILGQAEVNLVDFINILENALLSVSVSVIPLNLDSVFVGQILSNNFNYSNALFVLGLEEGVAPNYKKDTGIILDADINSLKTQNKLEPTIKELNFRSRFNFFQLLLSGEESLYLSYNKLSETGTLLKPSLIFKLMSQLFTKNGVNIKPQTTDNVLNDSAKNFGLYLANYKNAQKQLVKTLRKSYDGIKLTNNKANSSLLYLLEEQYGENFVNAIYNTINFENKLKPIKNAKELFFKENKIGVTQLEKYFNCPFVHFIDKGLKLKEKEKGTLRALDFGNILHEVAEKFGVHLKEGSTLDYKKIETLANNIVNKILNKPVYSLISKKQSNKNLILSLKQEAVRLCVALNDSYKNSDYDIFGLEYKVGFKTEDGYYLKVNDDQFKFVGVIDRIDVYKDYFRIIDYKTGNDKFDFSDLFMGKKIQLFIYNKIIEEKLNKKPSGVFYFPVKNSFKDGDKNHLYKLNGAYLNSVGIATSMDNALNAQNPTSKIINATLKTKDGSIVDFNKRSSGKLLTSEEFFALNKYAEEVSIKAIEEILNGNISPAPLGDGNFDACKYCKYNSICKFNVDENAKFRSVIKASTQTLKEAVNE